MMRATVSGRRGVAAELRRQPPAAPSVRACSWASEVGLAAACAAISVAACQSICTDGLAAHAGCQKFALLKHRQA